MITRRSRRISAPIPLRSSTGSSIATAVCGRYDAERYRDASPALRRLVVDVDALVQPL